MVYSVLFTSHSSWPLQNVQVCTYKYVSHQKQFDGEEQQDVDFSADVKLSCQSGEQATRDVCSTHTASRRSMSVEDNVWAWQPCCLYTYLPHPTPPCSLCHCSGHVWLPVCYSLLHPGAEREPQLRHSPEQQQVHSAAPPLQQYVYIYQCV